MIETIKSDWRGKLLVIVFLFFTAWWVILQLPSFRTDALNKLFGESYGVLALFGAIWGLLISKKWGGRKSVLGRAIIAFSAGLLFQEFGQIAYFYYFFIRHIAVPYPSIGDIGYFGSIPLYTYGTYLLAKASGVHVSLKSFEKRVQAVIIPVIMLGIAYLLFLKGYAFDWSHPLTIFLDFGYPLGQAIYVSFAILTYLLSKNLLGGVMRGKILAILFALCVQFISDYTFLYQTSKGTWTAGQIDDYLYVLAYFFMTFALLQMNTIFTSLKES